jgi:hypothetical protein
MAWYRFTDQIKQVNFVDFGLAIGAVAQHCKTYPDGTQPRGHIEILDVRLRSGRIAFDTSSALPTDEVPHLGLEAG